MKTIFVVLSSIASFNAAMWFFFSYPITRERDGQKELKKDLFVIAESANFKGTGGSAFRQIFFPEGTKYWEEYPKSQRENEIRRWLGFGWWDDDTQKWLAEVAAAEAVGFKKSDPFIKNKVDWMKLRERGGALEIGFAKCGLESIRREIEPADQIGKNEFRRRGNLLKESRVQTIRDLQGWMEKNPTYKEWSDDCEKPSEYKEIQLFEEEAPIWKDGSVMDLVEEGLITREEVILFLQALFNRGPVRYENNQKHDSFTRQYYYVWKRIETHSNLGLVFPQTRYTEMVASRMKEILDAHKVTRKEMGEIGLKPDHLRAIYGPKYQEVLSSR